MISVLSIGITLLIEINTVQKFKSTCAPDGPVMPVPERKVAAKDPPPPQDKPLTVAELKSKLKSLGEATGGRKEELVNRLAKATAKEASKEEKIVTVPSVDAIAVAAEGRSQPSTSLFQQLCMQSNCQISIFGRI